MSDRDRNPVASFYEPWWISPEGELYDAVRRGIPGHCAWLEERFGICTREDAVARGWVRVGWNMTEMYVQGKPERVEAVRATIERLLAQRAAVRRVVIDDGSELHLILSAEQFRRGQS